MNKRLRCTAFNEYQLVIIVYLQYTHANLLTKARIEPLAPTRDPLAVLVPQRLHFFRVHKTARNV